MSKQSIVKVKPEGGVPAWMQGDTKGTELLAGYVVLPRLKIVQKQATGALLELFAPGDLIISPVNLPFLIPPRDKKMKLDLDNQIPITFTPVFFWPEWATWSPIELKGTLPAVLARTTNPADPIAVKSRDPATRLEPYEKDPQYKLRHTEHLNFVIIPYRPDGGVGEAVVLSFSRGENFTGRKFSGLIQSRRAPIYGGKYEMRICDRSNAKGEWYGLAITNHEEEPWTDQETYTKLAQVHEDFKHLFESQRLAAAQDDDADQVAVSDEM